MSLAHYFTFLRIFISPLFPLLYIEYKWFGIPFHVLPYLLLFLLSLCEFSDFIDGIIARRRNQVTDLGKVLDPMADSITHISLFLTLTQGPVALPLILVLVFLYREFFITTLRTLCALRSVALGARFSGKMKTLIQGSVLFLILVLMIPYSMGVLPLSSTEDQSFCRYCRGLLYSGLGLRLSLFQSGLSRRKLWNSNRNN